MTEQERAMEALRDHHLRCFWCRRVYGCRKSDRLLSAYHRATR